MLESRNVGKTEEAESRLKSKERNCWEGLNKSAQTESLLQHGPLMAARLSGPSGGTCLEVGLTARSSNNGLISSPPLLLCCAWCFRQLSEFTSDYNVWLYRGVDERETHRRTHRRGCVGHFPCCLCVFADGSQWNQYSDKDIEIIQTARKLSIWR